MQSNRVRGMEPTLKQLRYFSTLVQVGQFRRAAEQLGIAQPSLSLQIEALEQSLGIKLLERKRSGILLTPAGRELLPEARQVLDRADALTARARAVKGGVVATLRLGSSPTIGPYLLPSVVSRLRASYPDFKLVVRDGAPRDLLSDLALGAYDLILTHLPVPAHDFHQVPIFEERLHLVVSHDHPLATVDALSLEHLKGQDVLSLAPGFTLHKQIAGLCDEAGARLREDYEGTSLDALRQMSAMNLGLVFLPALYVQSEITGKSDDIAVKELTSDRLSRSIGLAWRRTSGRRDLFETLADVTWSVASEKFAGIVEVVPRKPRLK